MEERDRKGFQIEVWKVDGISLKCSGKVFELFFFF